MADATVTVEWAPLTDEQRRPSMASNRGVYLPVEYEAHGTPIYDCQECMGWEVQVDVHDGQVWVREWHAEDCTILPIIRAGACHGGVLAPQELCPRCGAYNTDTPKG